MPARGRVIFPVLALFTLALDQATKLKDCEAAISGMHKAIAEITEGVRMLQEDRANNVHVGVSEAKYEELVKDLAALREKVHYACVEHEEPDINDAFAQIEILKNTVGTCLLRYEEVQQTSGRATKDVSLLRRPTQGPKSKRRQSAPRLRA